MVWRCLAFSFWLCLGCQTVEHRQTIQPEAIAPSDASQDIQQVQHTEPTAKALFLEPGETHSPIKPPDEPDWLAKASAAAQSGDNRVAAASLQQYLKIHPDHVMIRAYLAEFLFKCEEWPQAQHHFEKFAAAVQDKTGEPHKQLIHCYTRLMEIAQKRHDRYAEHLHRGIGMYLLEGQLSETAEPKGDEESAFREKILCKAVMELEKARAEQPDEARPCWYLYETWKKLDQVQPAQRALRQAEERQAFSLLTPAESRELTLALAVR